MKRSELYVFAANLYRRGYMKKAFFDMGKKEQAVNICPTCMPDITNIKCTANELLADSRDEFETFPKALFQKT